MGKQIIILSLLLLITPEKQIAETKEFEVPPSFKIVELELEENELKIPEKEHQESSAYIEEVDDFQALVRATWRLETGNGTSQLWLTHHNAGGIKCGPSYCRYNSQQEGLEHLARLLSSYVERFGYDFEAIRSVYSESDDTELFRQIFYEEKGV